MGSASDGQPIRSPAVGASPGARPVLVSRPKAAGEAGSAARLSEHLAPRFCVRVKETAPYESRGEV